MKCFCVLCGMLFVVGTTAGADIYGGVENPLFFNTPAEGEIVSGALGIGDGTAYKTGSGTLTIPAESIMPSIGQKIEIHEGVVEIKSSGTTASTIPEPSWLRGKAAMWLSADTDESQMTSSEENPMRWYDVRESDCTVDGFTPSYMFAESFTNTISVAYSNIEDFIDSPEQTEFAGKSTLYFGGYGSGKNMQYCYPSGTPYTDVNVFHYFVVHAVVKRVGALAGIAAKGLNYCLDYPFRIPYEGDTSNTRYTNFVSTAYGLNRSSVMHTRFYVNGKLSDISITRPVNGRFELVDFAVQEKSSSNSDTVSPGGERIDSLFRLGKNTVAGGGDYVSEVVMFTNILTHAERIELENYLMAKWGIASDGPKPLPDARIAASAAYRVKVPTGERYRMPFLSGEGVMEKTGGGTLVSDLEGMKKMSAPIALKEGAVISRGEVSFHAVAGQKMTAVGSSHKNTNAVSITVADAAEGAFVKAGGEDVEIKSIASDVEFLKVEEGRLRITGFSTADQEGYMAAVQEVPLENGDFETRPATSANEYVVWNGQSRTGLPGWTMSAFEGSYGLIWYWYEPSFAPKSVISCVPSEGQGYVGFGGRHELSKSVTLPGAGRYEVIVRVCGQTGNYFYRNPLEILLIDESVEDAFVTNRLMYTRATTSKGFRAISSECEIPAAGTYRLRVRSTTSSMAVSIDDIRLFHKPNGHYRRWVVPNGNFEKFSAAGSSMTDGKYRGYAHGGHRVEGWTLEQASDRTLQFPSVAFVTHATCAACNNSHDNAGKIYGSTHLYENPLFQTRRYPEGGIAALSFISNGVARTEFTAPKGKWRLKANVASQFSVITASAKSRLYATVSSGGATNSLGYISGKRSSCPTDLVWPLAFVSDGISPVTLELSFDSCGKAGLTIDDLELFETVNDDLSELVVDGSFEEYEGSTKAKKPLHWDVLNTIGGIVTEYGTELGVHVYGNYGSEPIVYSKERYEGSCYFVLTAGAGIRQTVDFPTAGAYEVSFVQHKRDDNYYSPTSTVYPLYLTVCDTNSSSCVTNFYVEVPGQPSTNFVKHAYTFRVPSAGKKHFVMQMAPSENNSAWKDENIIDCISIKPLSSVLNTAPVPRDACIAIAAGATLELGFIGTNRVESLVVDGVSKYGILSAENCPALAGAGCLEVLRKSTLLLIK